MPAELPLIGKVSREIFDEVILPHLGRADARVLVPPQHGVDVGVVDIGGGRVMALTTDPVFVVPQYGWKRAAWFALHILASDAATSGLAPAWMTVDLNLPLSVTRAQLEEFWLTFSDEADALGISIVAGHTGRYAGCQFPMVGGATVASIGPADKYVTPKGARPGDKIIVTKGCAIEAAGLFAATFQQKISTVCGEAFARRGDELFYQMSVVKDCLTAVSVGVRDAGVTAMHDATECGVWGGLFEIAEASEVGMAIDKGAIIIQDAVAKICDIFGIDPYSSISEGTLVLTSSPRKAAEVVKRLADKAIPSSVVGEVVGRAEGITYTEGGVTKTLVHPIVDPFWAAFDRELRGFAAYGAH